MWNLEVCNVEFGSVQFGSEHGPNGPPYVCDEARGERGLAEPSLEEDGLQTVRHAHHEPRGDRGSSPHWRKTLRQGKAVCVETSCVERQFHKAYLRLRWRNALCR